MCVHYICTCVSDMQKFMVLTTRFSFLGRQKRQLAEFWVGVQDVTLLTIPSKINQLAQTVITVD